MKNFGLSTPFDVSVESVLKAHEAGNVDESFDAEPMVIHDAWILRNRKLYPRFPKVYLPRAGNYLKDRRIGQILALRESNRIFKNAPVSLASLGGILDLSISVTDHRTEYGRRPVPSAGARYPIETYLIPLQVDDLAAGVYHYDPYEHFLEHLFEEFDRAVLPEVLAGQDIKDPAFLLVLTGLLHRTLVKYGGRGYRFVLLEAGGIAQEIDTCCRAANLGAVWLGGFVDRIVSEILDINQELEVEVPLLVIAGGLREE
jgi:SagB-type dehydrogenase family enzyme